VRQRSISAVGVVLVGIVPALFGGPVWIALLLAIGLISLTELHVMTRALGRRPLRSGYVVLPVIVVVAGFRPESDVLVGLLSLIVLVSFTEALTLGNATGSALDWATDCALGAYLAIPLAAAATLRGMEGDIDGGWLSDVADTLALGWEPSPRGLAWLLFVIVVTWLSDTGAYLVGRAIGSDRWLPPSARRRRSRGCSAAISSPASPRSRPMPRSASTSLVGPDCRDDRHRDRRGGGGSVRVPAQAAGRGQG
jgi:CDP-diglyceride synthetase